MKLPSLMLLALSACSGTAIAQTAEASMILVHGKVWTENPAQPLAQAVALDGTKILAVGDDASIRKLAGANTQVLDLGGRLLLPGFNDAHVHLLSGGEYLIAAHLDGAKSQAEFKQLVADYAKTLPKGAWILGGNWDHHQWTPAVLPTHQLIDGVSGDHPALLWRIDGHMAFANALALKLAGIDRNTKDVPGGEVERDKNGDPTGILKDAATSLVAKVIPAPSQDIVDQAMVAAMREAAAHGVTSVQNMAGSPDDPTQPDTFREFQQLDNAGKLSVRIYEAMPLRAWKTLADPGVIAPFGGPHLRIGNLKSFADGAVGSETAWMDAPFANNPANSGIASSDFQDLDHLYAMMRDADKAGLQISVHAIGDRANRTLLDLYARLEKENGPADRRLRIEHAQHLHPEDNARFAQLGVVASMQPYHAIDDGRWVEGVIGTERGKSSYAWKSLLDAGATLAFGSDWPVAPLDPVIGIYAATTRRTLDGKNPNGWHPEQRISVAQAVHAYTLGSAYAEHQEKVKGSIEPGKLADLVVLSDDIFSIAPEAIENTKVDITVFDGKVIYQRAANAKP